MRALHDHSRPWLSLVAWYINEPGGRSKLSLAGAGPRGGLAEMPSALLVGMGLAELKPFLQLLVPQMQVVVVFIDVNVVKCIVFFFLLLLVLTLSVIVRLLISQATPLMACLQVVLLVRHLPCFQPPLVLEVDFLDAEVLPLEDVQVVENLQLAVGLVVITLGEEEAQVGVHCLQLIFGEVGSQHGINALGTGDVGLREPLLGLLRGHQHLVALAQLVFVDLVVCVLANPVLPLPLGVDVVDLQLVVPLVLDVAGALRAVHQPRQQLSHPRFQHLLVLEDLGILFLVTVLLVENLVELTEDGPAEPLA